ncbi:MAG: hypothetical protein Q8P67_27085, partial [archaeon]|nr:hypothetical protein [archaeon]
MEQENARRDEKIKWGIDEKASIEEDKQFDGNLAERQHRTKYVHGYFRSSLDEEAAQHLQVTPCIVSLAENASLCIRFCQLKFEMRYCRSREKGTGRRIEEKQRQRVQEKTTPFEEERKVFLEESTKHIFSSSAIDFLLIIDYF